MKKKIFMLIILVMTMLYLPSVSAANITACNSILPNVIIDEKIPNIVHTIILVIQIAVPVLLVVYGMIDLVKGVMAGKEDEIKKGQQILIKRIIAAVLVFFVIAIVKFVIGLASGNNDIMDCADCFLSGNCTSSSTSESPTPSPATSSTSPSPATSNM